MANPTFALFANMSANKNMKTPKPVFVTNPAEFSRFEECLKPLAEKYLSPTWEWTYKVHGKVQEEIRKKDPSNPGLEIIFKEEGLSKHLDHDASKFQTPKTVKSKL